MASDEELMRRIAERDEDAFHALLAERVPLAGYDAGPDGPHTWRLCIAVGGGERTADQLAVWTDFDSPDVGPQLLAIRSGARGHLHQLATLAGIGGAVVADAGGRLVPAPHGLAEGLTAAELCTRAVGSRIGLAEVVIGYADMVRRACAARLPAAPAGHGVLARAMRSRHPGVVFAHAAATGEVDPLSDLDSRLFVGLPVKGS